LRIKADLHFSALNQISQQRGFPLKQQYVHRPFDNDWLRAELDQRGASAVIPPKAGRARGYPDRYPAGPGFF
jgi:hypothetical protein